MPLIPEEPQIHESAQGPRATPAAGRPAPTPRPVPGPRSAASPRPGSPGPGPARPTPSAPRPQAAAGQQPKPQPQPQAQQSPRQENRSASERAQPQIQLIPAPAKGALDAAEEAIDLLLESGRAPGDILVFTTGEQHPWATHELSFGETSYWAQHDARDDVFFADAATVERASTRPVVVVALNGGDDATAVRALPAAMNRAGALLIVCGDPQRINAVLGTAV
ncbi:hypothetical protein [Streptomyces sp. TRM64462]|uniref:hypothetical protein n=1 Tax=Streptomyces sp. TRM64462 TaxID=2741726 RepID=UPI001585E67B|nr:hypothetical protein [Streptomyces sp. TRM64462]